MRKRHLAIALVCAAAALSQDVVTFKTSTNLVIVNVEVRDRAGKPVSGLTAADFDVFENGVKQKVSVFEFQKLEQAAAAPAIAPPAVVQAPLEAPVGSISTSKPGELRYRDRRLIVLYFDLSSMGVAEQIRAGKAAEEYIRSKMTESDWVAVMTFSTKLKVLQDFTGDRETLLAVIRSLKIGEGSELSDNAADESAEDTGAAYSADSSEFDIFNTDRKLTALEDAVGMLGSLPEKKALVYLSGGVRQTGRDNDSQLQSTINAAIRANVAFYPIDARGLVAEAPAGDASVGAQRGSGMFTGQTQRGRRERFNNQQETLFTLAADTGGKAMLDSNDLSLGIVQAQGDFSSYYIVGYYTTNTNEDGRYRRVEVKVKSPQKLKLEYRAGYYGPKTFDKYTESDKERQLEEALRLGDPVVDLPLALEANYFRRARDRYIVPVAVKIPGSEIPVVNKKETDEARLDFIAELRDPRGRPVASVRDFIKIKLTKENVGQLPNRLLQYDTAFTVPPGDYKIKFVARENESGKIGTFETRITVPDLTADKAYLHRSSVVWGSQRVPLKEAIGGAENRARDVRTHPLVRENQKLIPSITKVFREGQELYVLLEVYEPGETPEQMLDLQANVTLFGRNGKALESTPVAITTKPDAKAVSIPIELRVPVANVPPGTYICQLSVVDKAGRKFAFERTPLVVLPKAETP